MSNPSITADKTPWYQWDTGLTVTVSGGEMNECHFANRKQGTAYVQAVINGVARVPDELLQVAAPIKAYGYVSDGAGGQTYIEETFEVIARNIPADYTYTKTAQKTIRDAEAARDQAVQAAKGAKASELAADDSAVEASNSAQSAGESASAAATSASNAATSANNAAKSASDAKAAADKAVEDASELLKTYTDNAKTSADNAATSASNAADAASAASGSASAAAQSATDANSAKVAAETAKDEAETAATNAATSASNAASSATAAAKSASDAADSVGAINVIAPKHVDSRADVSINGYSSVAIGNSATCTSKGSYAVAIGQSAKVKQIGSVMIGSGATESDDTKGRNVCVGDSSIVNGSVENSVAIGSGSVANKQLEFSIGNNERLREITHVSAPTADTSASTKKYTDDNDAKTLSESKKYTDDNTSNALVGTVSGKLLHVEDAWPGKPLGLNIDGAYKQDGTPSPEAPVPITVIENPALLVTGRNLLDLSTLSPKTAINSDNGNWYESYSGNWYANRNKLQFAFAAGLTLTMSVSSAAETTSVFFYDYSGAFISRIYFKRKVYSFVVPENTAYVAFEMHTTNYHGGDVSVIVGSKNNDYRAYTSATLPITLPAEHPYLAALPRGTHDEIVIDKDGNASLIARVKAVTSEGINAAINYEEKAGGADFQVNLGNKFIYGVGFAVSNVCVDGNVDQAEPVNGGVIRGGYVRMTKPEKVKGIASAKAYLIEIGFAAYIALSNPVTYNLGKLDIPALPETISNVWTDAELTTNMSMTYKRDINIAFENLVQAVVAAAAGE